MMSRESFTEVEQELVSVAAATLELFRARLRKAGLSFRGPEVEVCTSGPGAYSSELRIAFYRGENLDDVLEFFLFRDGLRVVTGHDIESWLTEQLEGMLAS